MSVNVASQPHRRLNPLTGEWVLVSPHRTQRPWQGQQEERSASKRPEYDESCYLCPGNTRAGGQKNFDFDSTFVFTNDYSALLPDSGANDISDDSLFTAVPESGICRIICFSPRHDLSVPHMELDDVASVIGVWIAEYEKFKAMPEITYAQIFENKGQIMGCSNPHPHCQIWASSSVPYVVSLEQKKQADYFKQHSKPMLVEYAARELEKRERVVHQNEHFVVLVPYWAVWPFETMVLPKRHCTAIDQFTDDEVVAFADAYKTLTLIYDHVFDCEFPYTAGIHQAPTTNDNHDAWQFHMHFYPPLLRSATVKKFMVGYEMLAAPQREITAESAAEILRQAEARMSQCGDNQ